MTAFVICFLFIGLAWKFDLVHAVFLAECRRSTA